MPRLKPANKFRSLQEICESNYRKLLRLIPHLPRLSQRAVAQLGNKPTLHLELKDRGRYTMTLELSYCLRHGSQPVFEPALKFRVYLDARMVEALGDCERAIQPTPAGPEALERKWLLNYFLAKWLDHCLYHGYRFAAVDDPAYADV
ncbi:hypothetical protein JCM13664_20550 [Methylothermus subterraneus]